MVHNRVGLVSLGIVAAVIPLALFIRLFMQDYGLFPAQPQGAVTAPEDLAPDDENDPTDVLDNPCDFGCNSSNCALLIDEDPDSTEDETMVKTTTSGSTIRFDFPSGASTISTDTDAQTFHVIMSRCDNDADCSERAGGANPNFSLDVYCNDVLDVNVFTTQNIASVDESFSGTWTFDDVNCAIDGADLQAHFTLNSGGGGPSQNWACIEALEWEVIYQ